MPLAGAGIGAALSRCGLMKLTRFDASRPVRDCTPRAHLGIALSLRAVLRPA